VSRPGRLVVFNVPPTAGQAQVVALFTPLGRVRHVFLPTDARGRRRGFAVVEFAPPVDVDQVLARARGLVLDGTPLRVERAGS
jgi:RNA recognition motif-containing protein